MCFGEGIVGFASDELMEDKFEFIVRIITYDASCFLFEFIFAEANTIDGLCNGRKLLVASGIEFSNINYIGGLKLMISFDSAQAEKNFIELNVASWKDIFSTVNIWDGQDVSNERIIGLKIHGLPLLLRDETSYNLIAGLFGKVMGSSDFTWKDDDVSVGKCVILSNRGPSICEQVQIRWKDNVFNVWVREEMEHWSPPLLLDQTEIGDDDDDFVMEEEDFGFPEDIEIFPGRQLHLEPFPANLGNMNDLIVEQVSKTAEEAIGQQKTVENRDSPIAVPRSAAHMVAPTSLPKPQYSNRSVSY